MKIAIIGQGNVGLLLYQALFPNHQVVSYGRNAPSEEDLEVDLLLIAVPDDHVKEVASRYPNTLTAHTAGAVPLLEGPNAAVFYPLYSFSKNTTVDWSQIPLLLETRSQGHRMLLDEVAETLSERVYWITSAQREQLHVAAVMVNNFTNHLYTLAQHYCQERGLPFEVLHRIMLQGPQKAIDVGPEKAQTGPAIRGDQGTINKHMEALGETELATLYQLLSDSIQKHHS